MGEVNEKLLEAISESISDGVVVDDANDRILIYNTRYADLHPNQSDFLARGVTFETLLRHAVSTGGVDIPEDRIVAWISNCISSHLDPAILSRAVSTMARGLE